MSKTQKFYGHMPKTQQFDGHMPKTQEFYGHMPKTQKFDGQMPKTQKFDGHMSKLCAILNFRHFVLHVLVPQASAVSCRSLLEGRMWTLQEDGHGRQV